MIFRYGGGSQAAHNVVTSGGLHHCFSQIGSGALNARVQTILTKKMAVGPIALANESKILGEKIARNYLESLTIDPECLITTPFHKIINQMQEVSRGNKRRGSCGMGVGQTFQDGALFGQQALLAKDLLERKKLLQKLRFIQDNKAELAKRLVNQNPKNMRLQNQLSRVTSHGYMEEIADYFHRFALYSGVSISSGKLSAQLYSGRAIFEGSQGALLDIKRGFWPHITHSDTMFGNADEFLGDMGIEEAVKIGVIRAYATRHGAGPFVTEDYALGNKIPDVHNKNKEWQGGFRVGWIDLVAIRYALECAGRIDSIAVTNLDRLSGIDPIKVCTCYEYIGKEEGLDQYFDWHREGDRVIINKIKKLKDPSEKDRKEQTARIYLTKPVFKEVEGWRQDISKAKSLDDLPVKAREYLEVISSAVGKDTPISIVSVGPKSDDKFFTKQLTQP
jgi:adenylosuccinate synthase